MLGAALALLASGAGPAGADNSCSTLATEPLPFPGPATVPALPSAMEAPDQGSKVEVDGSGFSYRYLVNGQAEVIQGMGYNPRYSGLGLDERAALYQRDFGTMAAAGVNTVFGWDPREFDELTLDAAARQGLGVSLPYDVDFQLDYADPAVRAGVRADVLAWVSRYRWHPALRVWAIGNETLHKLVPPSWCPAGPTAAQQAAALAFTRFYADLIDAVHALDPNHPVVYRAAEDSYVEWMRAALAPGGARPWFVYGLNVYTPRLAQVLDAWADHRFDVALLLSEFGPPPEGRPDGYRHYWATVRAHPKLVLGGAVYVWFADGPEGIDRVYGLVGSEDQPVDGSLETIRRIFRQEHEANWQ